jgi:hypothetical protein
MMMKQPKEKCPKCQKEVDLNEKICPFCGFNIKRFKIIFVIIIFPIGILLIYNLFNWFSSPQIPQNLPQEPCSTEMKQIAESYY